MLRLESNYESRSQRQLVTNDKDISETDLDNISDWDRIIFNNTSKESLEAQVKDFYYKNQ